MPSKLSTGFFDHIHPIKRMLTGLMLATITFLLLYREDRNVMVVSMCAWCVFALTYLALCCIIIFSREIADIKKIARINDGSQVFVALLVIVSSFASLVIVLLLVAGHEKYGQQQVTVPLSILSIILSWVMVHTVFAFHYAHAYYDNDPNGKKDQKEGLDFPGDAKPDYLDFTYFSFVIGMTFQVSDVQITSKKLRKLALLHGLIAFGINTFVVALTINLVAGLSK